MLLEDRHTSFDTILSAVLDIWPSHRRYLDVNLAQRDAAFLDFSETLSHLILQIARGAGYDLTTLAQDYRYLCEEIVLPEEFHFRRHGSYRLKTFEEAFRTVYANKPFMTRYMHGLILSDVLWLNHCKCMQHYVQSFLTALPAQSSLLEIGPGHGLLLALAEQSPNLRDITAWDVSDASLLLAAKALEAVGSKRNVSFSKRDIFDPSILEAATANSFDAIVLSEVLEHLEHPQQAVDVMFHLTRKGGRVWINVPANSPAPDHLYLVSDIGQPAALLANAGFVVEAQETFPTSGTTMEKAMRQKLTFNCVLVGRKP